MIRAAILAAIVATPVAAQECFERDHLSAWLQVEHDMRLVSWGLNEAGHMEELFVADSGLWAVVLTKPDHCTSFLSLPVAHYERLGPVPHSNKIERHRRGLRQGPRL